MIKKILSSAFLLPGVVFAQTVPPVSNAGGLLPGEDSSADPAAGVNFIKDSLAPGLTNGFLILSLAVATLMFVIAGIMYVMSNGDEEMVKKAKDTMLWTVVGVVIAILSLAIIRFLVGIDFTQ